MRFVIIGNGIAGFNVARYLTEEGTGAEVELYTREPYHYYPKPRLQEFLAGEIELDELYFRPPEWYAKRGIKVHLGTEVRSIDPALRQLVLDNGVAVGYDGLVLASGAYPFVPPIEGANQDDVFTYRTLGDCVAIRQRAAGSKRAVVVGGGLLGLEAARALKKLGPDVTVLELAPYLLPRQLDAQGGGLLHNMIRDMGITVELSAASQSITGDGKANGVLLKDGRLFDADMVLISAGIRSDVGLARAAGLEVNRGVVVDDHLRTGAPAIYAAGDVAEYQGRVYGIIPAALDQARVAAMNMLGEDTVYEDTVPSNTLKVAGIDCASVGTVNPEGEGYEEFRATSPGVYKKLVLKEGKLAGAILLGDIHDAPLVGRAIRSGVDVSSYKKAFLEDGFDWKTVL